MMERGVRSAPRVSIGLPVRDGASYLDEAIRSILGQTFGDLELIVSDNASSDATEEIAVEHAQRDPRVRYVRQPRNLGAARNFQLVIELARGEYLRWAAHDDWLEPAYLERCVEALDRDPQVVLAHTRSRLIDPEGRSIPVEPVELENSGAERPSTRFADVVLTEHLCLEIFGLVRADVLRATPLLAPYVNSDRVLLAELALRGRFHVDEERLFVSRDHPERSVRAIPFHLRSGWFDPGRAGKRVLPHWRTWREFGRALQRVPLPAVERARARRALWRWWTVNGNWARVASDLVIGAVPSAADRLQALKRRFYWGDRGWDEVDGERG